VSAAPERLKRTPWRALKDYLHSFQDQLAKWHGQPGSGMLTDLSLGSRRVIFIHNPKAGGTSLGKYLGVKRRTHAFPRDRLSERVWNETFSVVVVRDPFERFLSCYYGNVIRSGETGLTKRYGPSIKEMDPFAFLMVIMENPKFGGPQLNWTDYPSSQKPRADLVLKFEDISRWPSILAGRGLHVNGREMLHENRSERDSSDHLERLKLTEAQFGDLRQKVMTAFQHDCVAFGYS
jgi:hypothetical protein